MYRSRIGFFTCTVLGAVLFASAAHASFPYKPGLGYNPGNTENEMIEVGTAVRDDMNIGGNEADILLGVKFGGYGLNPSGEYMLYYVARVSAEVGMGLESGSVTSFDIRVRPVGITLGERNFEGLAGDAMLVDISRDLRLDQDLNVKVRAIEARLGWKFSQARDSETFEDTAAFLASVAVEALGYRYVNYLESDDFHGFYAGGIRAEIAERLVINEAFTMTAAMGASADFSFGASDGFSVVSDIRSYAAVRLNNDQFMEIYAQMGGRYTGDSGNRDWVTVGEVLAGLRFFY